MNIQPEALRLADELEAVEGGWNVADGCCAELRRLYAENELLHKRCQQAYAVGRQSAQDDMDALMRQALEALEKCRDWPGAHEECAQSVSAIRQHLGDQT